MKCYIKDYPRPQFVRSSWENLNGAWRFRFDDQKIGKKENWFDGLKENQEIMVPFTYETKASGIQDEKEHSCIWYERNVSVRKMEAEKLLLHFEGSDYETKVWVNGSFAGEHTGGYERFSFDITELVHKGENWISVCVEDSRERIQPRGKQRWLKENFGCWYVQTTGIWKTVWMEYIPEFGLSQVKMTPDLRDDSLKLEYTFDALPKLNENSLEIEAKVSFNGKMVTRQINQIRKKKTAVIIDLDFPDEQEPWGIHRWTPENPELYDIEFAVLFNDKEIDKVGSYFGMREIRIQDGNILLNGMPLYQRLILDQGYWEDSHLTPPSEEALIEDIDKIHMLGYNGLRKHQKIEDERFLYWCDVKGMLVWSEAPAAYEYSDEAVEKFTKEWLQIVKQNYNHPSIIVWTPFNESWGVPWVKTDKRQQAFTESIYYLTKSVDSMRPIISNDGWEHTTSDILTLHDYEESGDIIYAHYSEHKEEILAGKVSHSSEKFAFAEGHEYAGQPVIFSEFGGIAFTGDEAGWGYGNKVKGEEEFLKRFESIVFAVKKLPYVCGYCYTQVTDVQQEVNGLMDIRRNFKIDPEKIRRINEMQIGSDRKNGK